MKNKIQRIIATILSVLLISSIVAPVNAGAQNLPDEKDFSYAYADQLDLRLLEGFIFGADDQALSAAQLVGAQQAWKTIYDNTANVNPDKSTIDLALLPELLPLYIKLGTIELPLVGEDGLLEFVLPKAELGLLREFAHAPHPTSAHSAAGLISDDGGIVLANPPGDGGNTRLNLINLLSLDNTSIADTIISDAALELGALSAVAKKPDASAVISGEPLCGDLTPVDYATIENSDLVGAYYVIDPLLKASGVDDGSFCSNYQVADAKVKIEAPLLKELLNDIRFILSQLDNTLDMAIGPDGNVITDVLSALGTVLSPLLSVDITGTGITIPTEDIISQIIETPLQDDSKLLTVDLKNGLIEVDLKKLHSGNPDGLNGLPANSPLLTQAHITQILETLTSLLTEPPSTEAGNLNGLIAHLEGKDVDGVKQGGIYGTEIGLSVKLGGIIPGVIPILVSEEIEVTATLGGLLNQNATPTSNKNTYNANKYTTYYRSEPSSLLGTLLGLLGLNLVDVLKTILGTVGTTIDSLIFNPGGELDQLLAPTDSLLKITLDGLSPVLNNVLQPLLNVILNRQMVTPLPNGNLFTVSAVEINVATLLPNASLISIPLATASVMAQHWDPIDVVLNVAKVGDGKTLHPDGYTYDLICKLDEITIAQRIGAENLTYPSDRVGEGYTFNSSPNALVLNGAIQSGGLTTNIQLPAGALCEITANPTLQDEKFVGLRPTGDTPTRTPYTYFLDTDATGLHLSDSVEPTTGTTSWTGLNDLASINTNTVGDKWKNHSLIFEVAPASTTHTVNIVHAYDIDERDIVVHKIVDGPETTGSAPYTFEYSFNGIDWTPGASTISHGESLTIPGVPLLSGSPLAPTNVFVREQTADPAAGGPTVKWVLGTTPPTDLTQSYVGSHSVAQSFVANIGITVDMTLTPAIHLTATNGFPVEVDFEAMLPATGVKTLVWVLGLGLIVALGALALFVISRRK